MGKLQSDKLYILTHPTLKKLDSPPDVPPEIPPRMKKKKGPALPEKPPHIRAKSSSSTSSQQQLPSAREPLKPRVLNLDRPPVSSSSSSGHREVLVAASKSGRERPVEKRQREPAKLLMPVAPPIKKELTTVLSSVHHLDDASMPHKKDSNSWSRGYPECLPAVNNKEISKNSSSSPQPPLWALDETVPLKRSVARKSHPLLQQQPVLLIPRNLLTTSWGSAPVSYALWTQRDIGRGVVKPIASKHHQGQLRQSKSSEASDASRVVLRSGSVTRSGSLTSQGSSSSDSGGETFPKSVLKKQKRTAANANHSSSKGHHTNTTNNRKVEPKKNVTFNAFATVRLMEE